MEFDIIWSIRARAELKAIHDYIAADNPKAAERVCDAIYKRVAVLRGAPRLAQVYDCDSSDEVRHTVSGKSASSFRSTSQNTASRSFAFGMVPAMNQTSELNAMIALHGNNP